MKPSRIVALVFGCILVLPSLALLAGSAGLAAAYGLGRDSDGYFSATLDRVHTTTPAVTTQDIDFGAKRGRADRLLERLDADVRLRVDSATATRRIFVGIGPTARVNSYLNGVARSEVTNVRDHRVVLRSRSGADVVAPPTEQKFWAESASGPGTQELRWKATGGRWTAVVMNADGGPNVAVDVNVGAKIGALLPVALILLVIGAALLAIAVVLIVVGVSGRKQEAGAPDGAASEPGPAAVSRGTPVTVTARLDPQLSPWQWLVKWFLAIPHFVVLFFLWVAFVVLTIVAGFSILFTRRYPRSIFDFNAGVLRWTWRVSYYATTGGLGTDQYPPFSLEPHPEYPASLDIAYPGELSRGLVLVKWWLLAIPHYVVLTFMVGGSSVGTTWGGGLLGVLVIIAAVILLFTSRYPQSLFDLVIGLNRWSFRVIAYAALMTDEYPPFRLDQGGDESVLPEPVAITNGGSN
ncbi:MAG: DUF4389 domain-containing protein [Acidimicrobiia bacterium]|nr:DUF4389 domain-containing protein [Acidimicrobiia bacterium]